MYTTTRSTTTFTTAEGLNDWAKRKGFDAFTDEQIRRVQLSPLTDKHTYVATEGGSYICSHQPLRPQVRPRSPGNHLIATTTTHNNTIMTHEVVPSTQVQPLEVDMLKACVSAFTKHVSDSNGSRFVEKRFRQFLAYSKSTTMSYDSALLCLIDVNFQMAACLPENPELQGYQELVSSVIKRVREARNSWKA